MQAAHFLIVCLEGFPGWALGDRFFRCHVDTPLGFSNAYRKRGSANLGRLAAASFVVVAA
jgi:hypothetical protein